MRTLDPRAPFVLDTRELSRRPGLDRRVVVSEQAPADLGIDMLGVPEASAVDLDLRLESVLEGVLVTGTASVHVSGQCVRCLTTIEEDLAVDLQELYAYDRDDEDDETRWLEGDLLDLEPVLRDAVVLALPHNPLCGPDCPGLCPECGVRLADERDHSHGEVLDPRWAALSRLSSDDMTTAGPRSGPTEE